jgi:hypothetical protein
VVDRLHIWLGGSLQLLAMINIFLGLEADHARAWDSLSAHAY